MSNNEPHVERHILIGLITSVDYLHEIRPVWNSLFLQSQTARIVADWCIEYYDVYNKAPGTDLEGIYYEQLKNNKLPKDIAQELEEDILPDLSDEYERAEKFNVQYLLDRTRLYFSERNLELWEEEIRNLRETGDVAQAERLAQNYTPVEKHAAEDLDLSDPESLKNVEKAFSQQMKPIVEYPGALGMFINHQLTRDAFIAFLAPEKRGKSYQLLDLAKRGVRQRLNVAFFQAGDMSENQQLRRLGIHLAKKSDLSIYTGDMWEPVKDCIKNQADTCDLNVRESYVGLVGEDAPVTEESARNGLTKDQLINLYEENPDYKPCWNCSKYQSQKWGCSWIKKVHVDSVLQKNEAVKLFKDYFVKNKRSFRLSTHSNNTLSVSKINTILDEWYRKGFVPDMIIIDYADLLTDTSTDYRHKQNEIWKDLRSLSQERHCLVATATQADAKSYRSNILTLDNYTEDKRKFGHVTAMFGLNQDPEGRENEIGIMRINQIVVREGEANIRQVVHVLQNLKRGQPVLTSYF